MGQNVTKVCMQPIHSFSPSATLSLSVVLDGQAEFAAVHHAADAQTQLQVFVRQPQQNLQKQQQTATTRAETQPILHLPAASHPNLSALDVLWAAADVHGHGHDDLQPGLHRARPPLGHGAHPGQLHLLEAVQMVLGAVRQAEAGRAGEAVWVWAGEKTRVWGRDRRQLGTERFQREDLTRRWVISSMSWQPP